MKNIINNLNMDIKKSTSVSSVNDLRIKYIGKKGVITKLTNAIKDQPAEKKALYGKEVNSIRLKVNKIIKEKQNYFFDLEMIKSMENSKVDITQPGLILPKGNSHPLTSMTKKISCVLQKLGFSIQIGPEIVTDIDNFEKLNIPKDHPARDMQDTFFISPETLLRTHTSSVQTNIMESHKEYPIKIICPGKVYRRDDDDATHSHQFTQIEALFIDKNVTMSDLKATLTLLIKAIFGEKKEIRFRPSYFPFTEPSVEVDLTCFACKKEGCAICKQTGWIEVLGAGMVHSNVLELCSIDSKKYQGFAFGLGVERFAMLYYSVKDIRDFYKNDLKFIKQFRREF